MSARRRERTEVLIVGFGPTGQVLSAVLGAAGHSAIACEKHEGVYPTPRAGHFDHEVMRVFQDLGIAEDVLELALPADGSVTVDATGKLLSKRRMPWETPSGWNYAYYFYQPHLEQVLNTRVAGFPSVTLRTHQEVVSIHDLGSSVVATVRDLDSGEVYEIEAEYVVGADGANSRVRSEISVEQDDLGYDDEWLVVDVRMHDEIAPQPFDFARFYLDPLRPIVGGRIGGRYRRWEFKLTHDDDRSTFDTPESAWSLLKPWMTPTDGELIRHSIYRFSSLVAQTFHRGRVILAGDAAHTMPPFLGQGMCSGVRDAQMLGWVLDLILRKIASDELLEAYSDGRRANVVTYVRESMRMGQIVSAVDPEEARKNAVLLETTEPVRPPFQPLAESVISASPRAGELAVQPVMVTAGGPKLLDDLIGTGFRLLSIQEVRLPDLTRGARRVLESLGVTRFVVNPPNSTELPRAGDDRFTKWLGDAAFVLVRPDNYVFGSARDLIELSALLVELKRALVLSA